MKKIAAVLLAVLVSLSLAACGEGKKSAEERTSDIGNAAEDALTENVQTNDEADSESVEATEESERSEGTKILVVYFSATNTTEGVAEMIADSLSADIYEIVPEKPYTDADLDYHDDNSRTTIEMNDTSARPAISGSVEDIGQYDIVFIGYPIWWGDAPRIVSAFMESYDFSGKTMVPFCTSGSSGIGSSATNLEALTDGTTWISGTRFDGGSSRETIVDWINGLGLNIIAE